VGLSPDQIEELLELIYQHKSAVSGEKAETWAAVSAAINAALNGAPMSVEDAYGFLVCTYYRDYLRRQRARAKR
jgi:hypothetical protein